MARLQKKHSLQEKKKRREKIESDGSAAKAKNAKGSLSDGVIKSSSSSKKENSIKNSASGLSDKKNIFQQGMEYLQEVKSELKKVTWPTRKQTLGTTMVVIVLVAVVSIFLGLFDFGFSKLIQAVLA